MVIVMTILFFFNIPITITNCSFYRQSRSTSGYSGKQVRIVMFASDIVPIQSFEPFLFFISAVAPLWHLSPMALRRMEMHAAAMGVAGIVPC